MSSKASHTPTPASETWAKVTQYGFLTGASDSLRWTITKSHPNPPPMTVEGRKKDVCVNDPGLYRFYPEYESSKVTDFGSLDLVEVHCSSSNLLWSEGEARGPAEAKNVLVTVFSDLSAGHTSPPNSNTVQPKLKSFKAARVAVINPQQALDNKDHLSCTLFIADKSLNALCGTWRLHQVSGNQVMRNPLARNSVKAISIHDMPNDEYKITFLCRTEDASSSMHSDP